LTASVPKIGVLGDKARQPHRGRKHARAKAHCEQMIDRADEPDPRLNVGRPSVTERVVKRAFDEIEGECS
jgi:hypothetical protein